MKKIEAIIDPSEMEEVKKELVKIGIRRMTISKVDEFGSRESRKEFYRGDEYTIDVVKEFKIELIVSTDEMVNQVIEAIRKNTKIEEIEDREISVSPVERVVRLRVHPSHCARFDEKTIRG